LFSSRAAPRLLRSLLADLSGFAAHSIQLTTVVPPRYALHHDARRFIAFIFAEGDRPHLAAPIGAATRWGRFFSPSALVTSGAYRRPRAPSRGFKDEGDVASNFQNRAVFAVFAFKGFLIVLTVVECAFYLKSF